MQVAVSTTRPFHSALLCNALVKHGAKARIYSSAPRRYFRRLDPSVGVTLVPSLLQTGMHFLRMNASQAALHADSWLYDHSVAAVIRPGDLFIGWATASLATARAARRRGARFTLDRACPHVDFQQAMVRQESEKLGVRYQPQPAWFRERQLAEYAEAERILAPSEYTRATFPEAMQAKIVKAPLMGRCRFPEHTHPERHAEFTVGVVGGDPVRKGYLYLLEAWEHLALPRARLLIRSDADFARYPALQQRLARMNNVELVSYVSEINDFYQRCDAFVLPSVDDGFGMALFEAMANEVPCIATTHCGSSELLTPGRDGIVVPPCDADVLAEAILSLYEQEELRRSLGSAARATAAALGRNDSSPLYDAAIGTLLDSLASPYHSPCERTICRGMSAPAQQTRHRFFLLWPDSSVQPRELSGPDDPTVTIPDVRYPLAVLAQVTPLLQGPARHFYLTKDPHQLPEYGDHVIAVLLQEERCKVPAYALQVGAVLRNLPGEPYLGFRLHRAMGRLEAALLFEYTRDWLLHLRSRLRLRRDMPRVVGRPHILRMPLGYQSQQDLPQLPMAARTLDTFFAGDIATPFARNDYRHWITPSKTLARRQLWDVLAELRRSGEWKIALNDVRPDEAAARTPDYQSYSERMMHSRICVAPRGSQAETYRFYEGLRAGCLVFTNPFPNEPFLRDAPVVIVDNWRELPNLLRCYARDLATLERYRESSLHWWNTHYSEATVARQVVAALADGEQ